MKKRNRLISLCLVLLMVLSILPLSAISAFAASYSGTGTYNDPYLVDTYSELNECLKKTKNASGAANIYIKLTGNISASDRFRVYSGTHYLDLAGKTIADTNIIDTIDYNMFSLYENEKLVVNDSVGGGTVLLETASKYNFRERIFYVDGGEVVVNAGTFKAPKESAILIEGGYAVINGGTFECGYNVIDAEGGKTVINDGTFTSEESFAVNMCVAFYDSYSGNVSYYKAGDVHIKNGSFSGYINMYAGELIIEKGTFRGGDGCALGHYGGDLTVKGNPLFTGTGTNNAVVHLKPSGESKKGTANIKIWGDYCGDSSVTDGNVLYDRLTVASTSGSTSAKLIEIDTDSKSTLYDMLCDRSGSQKFDFYIDGKTNVVNSSTTLITGKRTLITPYQNAVDVDYDYQTKTFTFNYEGQGTVDHYNLFIESAGRSDVPTNFFGMFTDNGDAASDSYRSVSIPGSKTSLTMSELASLFTYSSKKNADGVSFNELWKTEGANASKGTSSVPGTIKVDPVTNQLHIGSLFLLKVVPVVDMSTGALIESDASYVSAAVGRSTNSISPGYVENLKCSAAKDIVSLTWDDTTGTTPNANYSYAIYVTNGSKEYYYSSTSGFTLPYKTAYSMTPEEDINELSFNGLGAKALENSEVKNSWDMVVEITPTANNGASSLTTAREKVSFKISELMSSTGVSSEDGGTISLSKPTDTTGYVAKWNTVNEYSGYKLILSKVEDEQHTDFIGLSTSELEDYSFFSSDVSQSGSLDVSNKILRQDDMAFRARLMVYNGSKWNEIAKTATVSYTVTSWLMFADMSHYPNSYTDVCDNAELDFWFTIRNLPQWVENAGVTLACSKINVLNTDTNETSAVTATKANGTNKWTADITFDKSGTYTLSFTVSARFNGASPINNPAKIQSNCAVKYTKAPVDIVIDSIKATGVTAPAVGAEGEYNVDAVNCYETVYWVRSNFKPTLIDELKTISLDWMDENQGIYFEDDFYYTCLLELIPDNGYTFGEIDSATVNGQPAYFFKDDDNTCYVWYTYKLGTPSEDRVDIEVSNIDVIDVEEPIVGNNPSPMLSISQYAVNNRGVMWLESDKKLAGEDLMEAYFNGSFTGEFKSGKIYTLVVEVDTQNGYVISDDVKVTFNGETGEFDPSMNCVYMYYTAESLGGLLGDANEDGVVNVKDATLIQKHVASIVNLSSAAITLSDVNGDGTVNVKDATAIQKYVASIDTGYPIGKPL